MVRGLIGREDDHPLGGVKLLGPERRERLDLPTGFLLYDVAEPLGDEVYFVDTDATWMPAASLMRFDVPGEDRAVWDQAAAAGMLAAAQTLGPVGELEFSEDAELFRFYTVVADAEQDGEMPLEDAQHFDPEVKVGAELGVLVSNEDIDLLKVWLGWLRGDGSEP